MHNCNEGRDGLCVRVVLLCNILGSCCDGCVDCDVQKDAWRPVPHGLGAVVATALVQLYVALARHQEWAVVVRHLR